MYFSAILKKIDSSIHEARQNLQVVRFSAVFDVLPLVCVPGHCMHMPKLQPSCGSWPHPLNTCGSQAGILNLTHQHKEVMESKQHGWIFPSLIPSLCTYFLSWKQLCFSDNPIDFPYLVVMIALNHWSPKPKGTSGKGRAPAGFLPLSICGLGNGLLFSEGRGKELLSPRVCGINGMAALSLRKLKRDGSSGCIWPLMSFLVAAPFSSAPFVFTGWPLLTLSLGGSFLFFLATQYKHSQALSLPCPGCLLFIWDCGGAKFKLDW